MTTDEKVAMVQVLNKEQDEDVINAFLVLAGEKILHRMYPFHHEQTEVPARYHVLQCKIASALLDKRGALGQTIHAENETHRHYENGDVSESMLEEVVPFSRAFGAGE